MNIDMAPVKSVVEFIRGYQGRTLVSLSKMVKSTSLDNIAHKGGAGDLVQELLGITPTSVALPDLEELGVELKTFTLTGDSKIKYSPKITMLSYGNIPTQSWQESSLYKKTRCIIFVPIIKPIDKIQNSWILGKAFYWIPTSLENSIMENSFNEIKESIIKGVSVSVLSGGYRRGDMLQVRTAGSGVVHITAYGESVKPRAFYILAKYLQGKLA